MGRPSNSEGEEVEVQLKVLPKASQKTGHGLLRTEGALAGDTEWDAIMEEVHSARKLDRPEMVDR